MDLLRHLCGIEQRFFLALNQLLAGLVHDALSALQVLQDELTLFVGCLLPWPLLPLLLRSPPAPAQDDRAHVLLRQAYRRADPD